MCHVFHEATSCFGSLTYTIFSHFFSVPNNTVYHTVTRIAIILIIANVYIIKPLCQIGNQLLITVSTLEYCISIFVQYIKIICKIIGIVF